MITSPHRRSWSYIAFTLHRLSGLVLALFLPFHFLVLGLAIEGEAALDGMLAWTAQPLVKVAEWGLVVLFALHLLLGLRVLVLEWAPWPDGTSAAMKEGWVLGAIVTALAVGTSFIIGVM